MFGVLLAIVLVSAPADTVDRDDCLDRLPVQKQSALPVESLGDAAQVWTGDRQGVPDTIRTYITQLQSARACFRELLATDGAPPYRELLILLRWEIRQHAALRQFAQVDTLFEKAFSLLDGPLRSPSAAETLRSEWAPRFHHNHGYFHFLQGNLPEALGAYLKAYQHTPTKEVRERATLLLDAGILHQRLQDYRSARRYYDRARRLLFDTTRTAEEAPSLRARVLAAQADLLLEESINTTYDPDAVARARDYAARSRAKSETGSERHARATLTLSESLGYLGRHERADRLNAEARRFARRHDEPRLQALALRKQGVLYTLMGRWTAAEQTLKRALRIADDLNALDYLRRTFRDLGRLAELQGDWRQAERSYREGRAVVEEYRETLTASEWTQTAFSQWRDVHRGLVRALLAQGKEREAFSVLDASRARHLQDLRTQSRVTSELSPPAQSRLDSLTQALTRVRNRLGAGASASEPQDSLRDREATLMAARQELLGPSDASPARLSVDSLSKALSSQERSGRALVSYFLDDPTPVFDRSPRSTAFLLADDTLRTISLDGLSQDSIRTLTDRISPLFQSPKAPPTAEAMHFNLRPLYTLQKAVYAPLTKQLSPDQPLTVVPDGPLFHVPYSTLVRRMPGGRFAPAKAEFVLHERPVAIELASRLSASAGSEHDLSSFEQPLAAFGVSTFESVRALPSALRTLLPPSAPDSSVNLRSLPGVERELDAVRRLVSDASIALNEHATEDAFQSACRRTGVLHLASHAFVHPSSPLHNAFLLHPDSSGRATDGALFLHELPPLDRSLPLVVLSGCSTARGAVREGEGMAGLQYAFRAMGAKATVANLWSVSDEASVALTETFYRQLRSGRPKDEALRRAKLDYLEDNPAAASPFFWGAAVLYGHPAALDLPARSGWAGGRVWMFGLLALLLGGGALIWMRRRGRDTG